MVSYRRTLPSFTRWWQPVLPKPGPPPDTDASIQAVQMLLGNGAHRQKWLSLGAAD